MFHHAPEAFSISISEGRTMDTIRGPSIHGSPPKVPSCCSSTSTPQLTTYSETEPRSWSDGSWFFPKAVRFLEIANYRSEVLAGIVTSIGSKTDSIVSSLFCRDLGTLKSHGSNARWQRASLHTLELYPFLPRVLSTPSP